MELTRVQRWLIAGGLGIAVAVVGVVLARRSGPASSERVVVQNAAPATVGSSPAQSSGAVAVHVVGGVRSPGVYTLPAGARVGDAVDAAGGVLPSVRPEWVNLAAPLEDGQQVYVPVTAAAPAVSPVVSPVIVPDPSVPGATAQTAAPPASEVVTAPAGPGPARPSRTVSRPESTPARADQSAVPAKAAGETVRPKATSSKATPTHRGIRFPVNVNSASEIELDALPHIGPALAARIIQHRNAEGPFRNLEELGRVKGIGTKTLSDLAPYVAF